MFWQFVISILVKSLAGISSLAISPIKYDLFWFQVLQLLKRFRPTAQQQHWKISKQPVPTKCSENDYQYSVRVSRTLLRTSQCLESNTIKPQCKAICIEVLPLSWKLYQRCKILTLCLPYWSDGSSCTVFSLSISIVTNRESFIREFDLHLVIPSFFLGWSVVISASS